MLGFIGVGLWFNRCVFLFVIFRRGGGCGFVCVVIFGCIVLNGRMVFFVFKVWVFEIVIFIELFGMKMLIYFFRKGLERMLVGLMGLKIVIIMLMWYY